MTGPPSIASTLRELASGAVTSRQLVAAALARADAIDPALGACVARFDEAALRAADKADAQRRKGVRAQPLLGLPIGVKDIVSTREGPSRANSAVADPVAQVQPPRDADCVARLRRAGCIVLGKLSTMEYAIGMPDPDDAFPIPRNPWDLNRWAGGSSSGSGSAVASGIVLGAVGTDTMASIRMPAAFCGITGFKPTYDVVSRDGVVPLAASLDHVGPMARSAADCVLLLRAMRVKTASTSSAAQLRAVGPRLDGVRIGVDPLGAGDPARDPALDGALEDVVSVLRDLGATVVPVELTGATTAASAAQVIMHAQAYAYHRARLTAEWSRYGPSARRRLVLGALLTASDEQAAEHARRLAEVQVRALFTELDLLVTPTVGAAAPRIADMVATPGSLVSSGPLYTPMWNLLGNPAVSLPMAANGDGLPLGVQLIGRHHDDDAVLAVAMAIQAVTHWHRQVPTESLRREVGQSAELPADRPA